MPFSRRFNGAKKESNRPNRPKRQRHEGKNCGEPIIYISPFCQRSSREHKHLPCGNPYRKGAFAYAKTICFKNAFSDLFGRRYRSPSFFNNLFCLPELYGKIMTVWLFGLLGAGCGHAIIMMLCARSGGGPKEGR